MTRWLFAALVVALSLSAQAKQHRSHAAKAEFQRHNWCPSTHQPRGRCPGYVIDHIVPLCAGGPDKPSNMQWQTTQDAKAKDKIERRECAKAK